MTSPSLNNRVTRARTANRSTRPEIKSEGNEINRGEYFGLTSEEIRILRTIKEETRQRGGFVRIFPVGDTFEFFSSFFEQRTTTFNQMIHQRLYPSRWTQNLLNCQQNSSQIRRTTVPRCKHLSSAFNYGHPSDKDLTPKTSGCDLDEALERFRIYERRLIDIVPPNSNVIQHFNEPQKSISIPIPTEHFDENSRKKSSIVINHSVDKQQSHSSKSDSSAKRLTTVSQLVKQQQVNLNPAPGEGRHSVYAKNDILQMLNQGFTLRFVEHVHRIKEKNFDFVVHYKHELPLELIYNEFNFV